MKKFQFPLDGLLKIRKMEESQAERALRQAQQRLWEAERILQEAEAVLKKAISELRNFLSGQEEQGAEGIDVDQLLVIVRHISRAERQRLDAEQLVASAQAEVSRCLNEYRECRRRREILEELREKAWQRWLMDFIREEQKAIDERALRDYALSKTNGV